MAHEVATGFIAIGTPNLIASIFGVNIFGLNRISYLIGKGLKSNTSGAVDLSRYSEHVPGKNLLIQLSTAAQFFSLQEFVELYADSYHVELESEKLWPVEPLVKY